LDKDLETQQNVPSSQELALGMAGDTADEPRAAPSWPWTALGLLAHRIVGGIGKEPESASAPSGKSREETRLSATDPARGEFVATDPMGEGRPPAARIGGDELRCITEPSEL